MRARAMLGVGRSTSLDTRPEVGYTGSGPIGGGCCAGSRDAARLTETAPRRPLPAKEQLE